MIWWACGGAEREGHKGARGRGGWGGGAAPREGSEASGNRWWPPTGDWVHGTGGWGRGGAERIKRSKRPLLVMTREQRAHGSGGSGGAAAREEQAATGGDNKGNGRTAGGVAPRECTRRGKRQLLVTTRTTAAAARAGRLRENKEASGNWWGQDRDRAESGRSGGAALKQDPAASVIGGCGRPTRSAAVRAAGRGGAPRDNCPAGHQAS